ncbi:MAG: 3-deoxy-D-manno-octulosonate 8-phosphate phosphatase (KDO 8-P phosphatase) [Saprospiraceae bacterium]|jgi:3-deoxy-D-manno-octulosonate 8-phosphate phosphatase (KDO 8-P phosphatase)
MDYSKLSKIENFIFDVDGVLTNCRMLITEEGEFLRTMNVRDGAAMKMALNAGFRICIITKGSSIGVKDRLILLGADPVFDKVSDKRIALKDLEENHNISLENSLYMGDDLADLVVFDKVLLATCPRDAVPEVIKAAEFISPKDGGDGCVRDIIERVLRTQGKWGPTD